MRHLVPPCAAARTLLLALLLVAQVTGSLQAGACAIEEFAAAGTTVLIESAGSDAPADPAQDCCRCDTCTDGCVHAAFASASFANLQGPLPTRTTPTSVLPAGVTPTGYPVDLRPPIEG